ADVGAPFVAPPPVRPYLEEVQRPPGRLRIALRTAPFTFHGTLHPDCHSAVDNAVRLCTELGHIVEDWHYDIDWEFVRDATRLVVATEVAVTLKERAQALGRAFHAAEVEPETWRLVEVGQTTSATGYLEALHTLYKTGRQFNRAMQGYDAVLTP